MLKATTTTSRAPRGTKPVSQAFFTALDAIPEGSRAAVGKAAQAMIREEMKTRKEKMKAAAAKEKAAKPAAPAKAKKATAPGKSMAKTAPAKAAVAAPAAKVNGVAGPAKRRTRKPVDVPTAV